MSTVFHNISLRNYLEPSANTYEILQLFKDVRERNQYKDEIEKIEKEMRFFLETEGMVEIKDTGALSYEDLLLLLLLLDFVWFPLVKTFIINWGKSMVPHGMRWDLNDVQRRF